MEGTSSNVVNGDLLLSLDPGSSRTGWALFKFTAIKPLAKGIIKGGEDAVTKWLLGMHSPGKLKQILCEDYTMLPHKKHGSTSAGTIVVIGKIRFWAELHEIPLEMVRPSEKDKGAHYTGIGLNYVGPGKHMPDDLSAMNHGARWLVDNKHVESPARERLRRFNAQKDA